MVNLCISLPGLRDPHIAGKTLFLGGSVRAFLEEIRLSKGDHPHQCEWVSSNPLKPK